MPQHPNWIWNSRKKQCWMHNCKMQCQTMELGKESLYAPGPDLDYFLAIISNLFGEEIKRVIDRLRVWHPPTDHWSYRYEMATWVVKDKKGQPARLSFYTSEMLSYWHNLKFVLLFLDPASWVDHFLFHTKLFWPIHGYRSWFTFRTFLITYGWITVAELRH